MPLLEGVLQTTVTEMADIKACHADNVGAYAQAMMCGRIQRESKTLSHEHLLATFAKAGLSLPESLTGSSVISVCPKLSVKPEVESQLEAQSSAERSE